MKSSNWLIEELEGFKKEVAVYAEWELSQGTNARVNYRLVRHTVQCPPIVHASTTFQITVIRTYVDSRRGATISHDLDKQLNEIVYLLSTDLAASCQDRGQSEFAVSIPYISWIDTSRTRVDDIVGKMAALGMDNESKALHYLYDLMTTYADELKQGQQRLNEYGYLP